MAVDKAVPTADVLILNAILQKLTDLIRHVDTQINITVAFSSAIFLFSIARSYDAGGNLQLYLVILILFSGLSIIVSLLGVHPPRFMRKKGQKESRFYHGKIRDYSKVEQYANELLGVFKSRRKLIEEYGREIYNLSKYYYRPKRVLYKLARNLLVTGFFLSFTFWILSLIII